MIPGALPAVLRYSVEVNAKGTDGRPMTDVRECDGWLELQEPLAQAFGEPPPDADAEPDAYAPMVARFWHCGAMVPELGDVITAHALGGAMTVATYLVVLSHADHLLIQLHTPAAEALLNQNEVSCD